MRAFFFSEGDGTGWGSYALLAVVVATGMVSTLVRQLSGHGYYVDLTAFYCGGSSLLHHEDPYTTPAVACTQAIKAGAAVLRAPHPPFALILYALMAMFPFKLVSFVYAVLAWLAIGASALCLSRFARIDAWIAALGLAPLAYYCIAFGQPTPFVTSFIVACAYCIVRKRFVAAALFAAATLVFPQVGIPVVLAVFVCCARARAALGIAVAVLALAGLLVLGPAANLHYVTVSLKLEQLQTSGDALQFGLPWLLQQFDVPAPVAAALGTGWYLVVLVAGIAWLRRTVNAASSALVALLPPALVALSSSFVHPQHFALALPFAMYALASTGAAGAPVLFGTALLLVPWTDAIIGRAVIHDGVRAAVFAGLGLAFASCVDRIVRPVRGRAAGVRIALIVATYAIVLAAIHAALAGIASVDEPPSTLATLSFKLPTIVGLLIVVAYELTQKTRPATTVAP